MCGSGNISTVTLLKNTYLGWVDDKDFVDHVGDLYRSKWGILKHTSNLQETERHKEHYFYDTNVVTGSSENGMKLSC